MAIKHFTLARFEEKYDPCPMSGCWIWAIGPWDRDGYGYQGHIRAHRLAWELFFGPIPAGASVLHKCDVRCCVNPNHLFLGTQRDNAHDAMNKRRHCFGEKHGMSRLTEAQVLEILALRNSGIKGIEIARRFGVTPQLISQIVTGKNWAHLTKEMPSSDEDHEVREIFEGQV